MQHASTHCSHWCHMTSLNTAPCLPAPKAGSSKAMLYRGQWVAATTLKNASSTHCRAGIAHNDARSACNACVAAVGRHTLAAPVAITAMQYKLGC